MIALLVSKKDALAVEEAVSVISSKVDNFTSDPDDVVGIAELSVSENVGSANNFEFKANNAAEFCGIFALPGTDSKASTLLLGKVETVTFNALGSSNFSNFFLSFKPSETSGKILFFGSFFAKIDCASPVIMFANGSHW